MLNALHLFANHKVTGPAELALDTAIALDQMGSDIVSRFLPARHPKDPYWLGELALKRNANLVEVKGLHLQKHFNPIRAFLDSRILAKHLKQNPVDLIHCHMPNDHVVAGMALRKISRRIPIIRTVYDGSELHLNRRAKSSFKSHCSGLILFSSEISNQMQRGDLSFPKERIKLLAPPIDTERFHPPSREEKERFRKAMGIPPTSFVAGIVARMQPHRRFGPLLEAIRSVQPHIPGFRFVIIGRGTHQEKVARTPVREMGLQQTVLFAGFREGPQYLEALQTLDVKVFLVPGSDGTCRAVREALASGIPVIAARRGILPTLIEEGKTGFLIDDSRENIAKAILDAYRNHDHLDAMKQQSRKSAEVRFPYRKYIREVRTLWEASL